MSAKQRVPEDPQQHGVPGSIEINGELKSYSRLLDRVMSSEATRVAWLMGFLTGTALVDDDTSSAGSKWPSQEARR